MHYAATISVCLSVLICLSQPVFARDQFEFIGQQPAKLELLYLKQRIRQWLVEHPQHKPSELAAHLQEVYLQWGYPSVKVRAFLQNGEIQIELNEEPEISPRICYVSITGGTPQTRFTTRWGLKQQPGEVFDRTQLMTDLEWIRNNHFIPIQMHLTQIEDQSVEIDLHIPEGNAWVPVPNASVNNITGLSLTAGVIANDPLNQGNVFRASVKRNNLPALFFSSINEIQDWEYSLSWATTNLPNLVVSALPWEWASPLLESGILSSEGLSFGLNHYNKVDFIYPNYSNDPVYERSLSDSNDLLWIRTLGVDAFMGLPLWSDIQQHQYLRGVFNLSFLQDAFYTGQASQLDVRSVSQSGQRSDLLLLPSFSLVYSDLDDYRLMRNGNFIQARLSGALLDDQFVQGTVHSLSIWSPWILKNHQISLLLRSDLGTTFGLETPFYRGFLNTGRWLIRGASSYSVRDKHSVSLSEEVHYIYRPTVLELEQFSDLLISQSGLGLLDGWSFDANLFLDQGSYWRDDLMPRSVQASVGLGVNTIAPNGMIIGADFALPVTPFGGKLSVLMRISAPLSFTLFSDWINTNGFFWR